MKGKNEKNNKKIVFDLTFKRTKKCLAISKKLV